MAVDGSLIFNTRIDADGFEKGLRGLSSRVIDLKNKVKNTETVIKNLRAELEKTANTKVKTKTAEGMEKDFEKANEQLRSLGAQADEIIRDKKEALGTLYSDKGLEYLLKQDKAWQQLQKKIDQAQAKAEQYKKALEGANASAPLTKDTAAFQQKEQRLQELEGQLDVYKAKLNEAEQAEAAQGSAAAKSSDRLSSAKRRLTQTITALRSFAKGAAKAGRTLKTAFSKTAGRLISNIGNHFRKANSSTNVLEKSLRRIKNTLVRMFFMRLVHSPIDAVKDGLGEIAKVSPEVNKNLSAIKTESTYLKNSLAALAAPLVSMVTPAFVSFMETLSGVTSRAGQLIAALTGQSYTKAVKVQQDYAASLDDSTKSADKNTKALEKNQRALAGFDELNVLDQSESDDDSSAGSNPMFENVGNQIDGLSGSLLNALKNQDFEAVGAMLGDKINEGLGKIKWDKIKNKAKNIAEKITGFLNGFLKKTDWKLVGSTIGEGITTALIFSSILFSTLDWSGTGSALHEIIKGVFTGENLNLLGATVANGLNGLIDLGTALLGDPDFKQMGENFENSLERMLKTIKWGELSHLFFRFVTGIFEFSNGFTLSINWKDFGKRLSKSFSDFFGEGGDGRSLLVNIGETVGSFIVGTSDFIIAFFEDPKSAENFAGAIEKCFKAIPWVQILIKSITGGIEIGTWIIKGVTDLVNDFCHALSTGFSDMEDDPELSAAITSLGKAIGNLFIGIINSMFGTLFTAVPNLFISLIKAVLSALSWVLKFILGEDFYNQSMSTLDNWKGFDPKDAPQIPYLATGTVVPANYGEFLAVLGDNKREAEVVSPVSAIKQAVLEALAEGSFSGSEEKEINLYIDGDRFFSWMVGKNREFENTHGYSAFKGAYL